jgi:hypothetical protein
MQHLWQANLGSHPADSSGSGRCCVQKPYASVELV